MIKQYELIEKRYSLMKEEMIALIYLYLKGGIIGLKTPIVTNDAIIRRLSGVNCANVYVFDRSKGGLTLKDLSVETILLVLEEIEEGNFYVEPNQKERIITISSELKEQFFFTNDHCQKHPLGSDWVSCTTRIPMVVTPRVGCEDGIIKDKATYMAVYCKDMTEIPNPQPEYQE